jgi:FMN phosphatase YigB (HAD superfamily)
MIDTIIFDFGDVFIDKNNEEKGKALKALGLKEWNEELEKLERKFETGKINEEEFLAGLQKYMPPASLTDIKTAWNAGIGEFPLYRLEFLQKVSQNYRLFLLSNTDPIHMEKFEQDAGASFYSDFYQCFEAIYFSHEIGYRKPEEKAMYYLINKHDIQPKQTLFVDDKEINVKAAEAMGFQVWHLKAGEEDVVDLLDKKIILINNI